MFQNTLNSSAFILYPVQQTNFQVHFHLSKKILLAAILHLLITQEPQPNEMPKHNSCNLNHKMRCKKFIFFMKSQIKETERYFLLQRDFDPFLEQK